MWVLLCRIDLNHRDRMGSEIYFDNNATTKVAPEVFEAMKPYLSEFYGNPSSIHSFGSQVGRRIQVAREKVAALLGAADPVEVVFTSCGTEADNAAIRGILETQPSLYLACRMLGLNAYILSQSMATVQSNSCGRNSRLRQEEE